MSFRKMCLVFIAGMLLVLLTFSACSGSTTTSIIKTTPPTTTPSTSPGGGSIINSDSIITGTIENIRSQATGYPWEIDVRIASSQNVGDLPNPTADKVGQVVTMKTDENIGSFTIGQSITAKVKYVGDVPKPGITLYIYDIKAAYSSSYQ
jgi:hypothetical protein